MLSRRSKADTRMRNRIASLDPDRRYLADNIFHQELTEERKSRMKAAIQYSEEYLQGLTVKKFRAILGATLNQDWADIKAAVQAIHNAYVEDHDIDKITKSRMPQHHLARILDAIIIQKTFNNLSVRPEPFESYAYWLFLNHLRGHQNDNLDLVSSQDADLEPETTEDC
ncbi:hypothetical protein TWF481_002682 [Arthrobotrys musiformis]|uniref:Uncharacterized protein n=1 Tax=Arthrobotrys musiformis TaxID=47236 RepID=A0AAV9VSX9_9PEZI